MWIILIGSSHQIDDSILMLPSAWKKNMKLMTTNKKKLTAIRDYWPIYGC